MATATKGKTKAKKTTKRAGTKATKDARKQMWAVVLFAAGILLGALTFIEGAKLWKVLHNFLFGMLGLSTYFLAPLLIYIAVIAAMDKPLSSIKGKLWQVATLIAIVSGAFQIFGPGLPRDESFIESVIYLYQQGSIPKGGGLIGSLVAWPLLGFFEKTGAGIIIVLLIFVFAMLITGSTLIGLIRAARKPVESLEEAYTEHVLERQERLEAMPPPPPKPPKAARKSGQAPVHFAYDVDISGDSEGVAQPEVTAEQAAQADKERLLILAGIAPVAPVPEASANEVPAPMPEPEIVELVDRYMGPAAMGAETAIPPVLPSEDAPSWEVVAPTPLEMPVYDVVAPAPLPAGGTQAAPLFPGLPREELPKGEVHFPALEVAAPPVAAPAPVAVPEPQPAPAVAAPAAQPVKPAAPPRPKPYTRPDTQLLRRGRAPDRQDVSEELKNNAQTLVDTLKSFGVQTRITEICRGPAVTRYELQPSAGVKISKITGLTDDIALNLASAGIRIEAPIPNKAAVGIEVPNKQISMVTIRELLESEEFRAHKGTLTVALGKDIAGGMTLADIGRMPHVLIAGATGSGKSVCINSIIMSLLFKYSPEDVKLLMVDPKVVELGVYNGIPHLLVPVVTDPRKAAGALGWAVARMMERYQIFAANGVKDLAGYNRLAKTRDDLEHMPKIVIIIDELADLMMAAPNEVEDSICRLAQMARAAGMHLVIATQRPSVDVITGVIKANIPSRIAFAVSSQVDSRTILDMGGAEKLLGRGDMLFYPVGIAKPMRVQGCFVTENEVESVVSFIKESAGATYDDSIMEDIDRHAVLAKGKGKGAAAAEADGDEEDEMLPQAMEVVVEMGQASTSSLQRKLKLGYARAARIIDQLEQKGVVGPFEGSKPRQVLISKERWMEMKLSGAESALLSQTRLEQGPQSGLPTDDPVLPPSKAVKARPDEFEFADLPTR